MTVHDSAAERPVPGGDNVKVAFEDGIAWLKLNRPDKRNAMSVALATEMNQVLDELELDDRCGVVVKLQDLFRVRVCPQWWRPSDIRDQVCRRPHSHHPIGRPHNRRARIRRSSAF